LGEQEKILFLENEQIGINMDLQGQATCEKYTKKGILWTTLVALVVGLVTDDYLRMVQVFILGVVLVAMVSCLYVFIGHFYFQSYILVGRTFPLAMVYKTSTCVCPRRNQKQQ